MDVGIYLDGRNPPQWARPWPEHYARTLELVERAEALGAASVWLSEHHFFEDGYLPQPLTFAAAIAARTSTIRIGTAVLLAALRAPAQLAEEAAVVDILSNGRLDLGVGLGYRVPGVRGLRPPVRQPVRADRGVPARGACACGRRAASRPCRCSSRCRSGAASSGRAAPDSPASSARGCSRSTPTSWSRTAPASRPVATTPRRRASPRCATSCSPTTPRPCGRS